MGKMVIGGINVKTKATPNKQNLFDYMVFYILQSLLVFVLDSAEGGMRKPCGPSFSLCVYPEGTLQPLTNVIDK